MAIEIYNTLTRRKETFEPLNPPHIKWYNCGPTVYDHFHLGNARTFVTMDAIRRYLLWRGYRVTFAQNLTDIDDRIIARANEQGADAIAFAAKYTQAYFDAADRLGILRADIHPRATQTVDKIVEFIAELIERGFAYEAQGSVYYRVAKFADYGKLSGNRREDLREGARIEVNATKEDPADFDLWKAAKPGEPQWPSPWGPGRPGWHIECSAMCREHLGETLDIHSGGSDLTFPHHENEIAQSEAVTGKPLARYWLHGGMLTLRDDASGDAIKMSKSLGNDMKIDKVLDRYEALAVRMFLLSAHYRSPLLYHAAALEEAASAVRRLRDGLRTAQSLLKLCESGGIQGVEQDRAKAGDAAAIDALLEEFRTGMDDDFNTPRALAAMHKIVNEIHEVRRREQGAERLSPEAYGEISSMLAAARTMAETLGLGGLFGDTPAGAAADGAESVEGVIQLLIATRTAARAEKAFALSDAIRDRLKEAGCALEDHSQGTIWKAGEGTGGPSIEALLEIAMGVRESARKDKRFAISDTIRDGLDALGFTLEDHPQGTVWKRK